MIMDIVSVLSRVRLGISKQCSPVADCGHWCIGTAVGELLTWRHCFIVLGEPVVELCYSFEICVLQ
jgi:hypothetical protein